jgi:L-cystine uptake protein TcyP (sodium:dicarboxylate symporter family)
MIHTLIQQRLFFCMLRGIECGSYFQYAWEARRNNLSRTVDWQFTTADARIKLKRLYPLIVY